MLRLALHLAAVLVIVGVAGSAQAIEGNYHVKGSNAGDSSVYSAVAQVQRTGDTFSILFKQGNIAYIGTGIVVNDVLSVVFQPLVPNARAGVASYRIVNDVVVGGRWTLLGGKTAGTEEWTLDEA